MGPVSLALLVWALAAPGLPARIELPAEAAKRADPSVRPPPVRLEPEEHGGQSAAITPGPAHSARSQPSRLAHLSDLRDPFVPEVTGRRARLRAPHEPIVVADLKDPFAGSDLETTSGTAFRRVPSDLRDPFRARPGEERRAPAAQPCSEPESTASVPIQRPRALRNLPSRRCPEQAQRNRAITDLRDPFRPQGSR